MEHPLKKKTKHLIAIRTNNFIDSEIEKESFFKEVLQTLKAQLNEKQFQFLTTYLLFQQNSTTKKVKHQHKNFEQKRISTQPDERTFNLHEIDPNFFQVKSTKQDNFVVKRVDIKTNENDQNCTNTPKKRTKHLIFQNKRVMDLDKRLKAKYEAKKNLIVYNPNILSSKKENEMIQNFFIKAGYQNSLKRIKIKGEMRGLKTSFTQSREQLVSRKQKPFDFQNVLISKSIRNEIQDDYPSTKLRSSENSIPKYLLQQVALSRRYYKIERYSNDFSDFKLTSRYKDCFS